MKIEEIIEIINDNDIEIAASIEPLEEGIFIGKYNDIMTSKYVYVDKENYDRLNKALQNVASVSTIKIFKWVKFFGICFIISIIAGVIATICAFAL